MSYTLSRRQFLAGSLATLGANTLRPAFATTAQPKLPIPTLVDGSDGAPIALTIRNATWQFIPGIDTPTLGINQNYLGPTIRVRRGSELNLRYHNTLAEGVAIHAHGLHVPGDVDGGPQLEIPPGEIWQPKLSIAQAAATCWYHSHTHAKTGAQVYRGLAGMFIIDEPAVDELRLPNRYGVDDLPVIIQDRTFDPQGRLVYEPHTAGQDGWFGDTVLINGAISPHAQVPAGKVRLRLLNAANARFYIIRFADNRVFHKIASDGGLLTAPMPTKSMEMGPGERCEIIVDMTDGSTAELLTLFEDELDSLRGMVDTALSFVGLGTSWVPSLTLKVDPALTPNTAPLPENLNTITVPNLREVQFTRDFHLTMNEASLGGTSVPPPMDMKINGEAMDMNIINQRVRLGRWERWRFRSNLGEHPFHVHGCSFLVQRQGGAAIPPTQLGWKDTVILDDDGWSEILVRFNHPATDKTPYMYHCHILEHEDRGMMGQFTVR